jgi:hypothetical protein
MEALARGHFGRDVPHVRAMPGSVIIQFPILNQRIHLRGPAARINLNASLPWEIEFRSDARRVSANLQALQLNSLDILGHASQIRLALSKPVSTAYIYIAGGADQVRVIRPHGTGMRIQLHDGATHVSFDEQHFDTIAGEALLESKDYPNSTSRYDISICGNINVIEVSPGQRLGST